MLDIEETRVRLPFRLLAAVIALLGILGVAGLSWAAVVDDWRWGLAALAVALFVVLMAIVAIRGKGPARLLEGLLAAFELH